MHLSCLTVFALYCFFLCIQSAPIEFAPQDTNPVFELTIKTVLNAVRSYQSALQALERNMDPSLATGIAQEVMRTGQSVVDASNAGARELNNAREATYLEATSIIAAVDDLASTSEACLKLVGVIKPTIINMGGQHEVIRLLEDMGKAADLFTDAMTKKMPIGASAVGKRYGQRIKSAIDGGIKALKGRNVEMF